MCCQPASCSCHCKYTRWVSLLDRAWYGSIARLLGPLTSIEQITHWERSLCVAAFRHTFHIFCRLMLSMSVSSAATSCLICSCSYIKPHSEDFKCLIARRLTRRCRVSGQDSIDPFRPAPRLFPTPDSLALITFGHACSIAQSMAAASALGSLGSCLHQVDHRMHVSNARACSVSACFSCTPSKRLRHARAESACM